MIYIDALNIIDACIENGILKTQKECIPCMISPTDRWEMVEEEFVLVYRGAPSNRWEAVDKETLAQELMADEEGQAFLKSELQKRGVTVKPFDMSGIDLLLKITAGEEAR